MIKNLSSYNFVYSEAPTGTYFKNLNRSWSGSMTGTHVTVALSDGSGGHGVSVFTVHVVSSRSRIVSDPDTEVLDNCWRFLRNFLD